MGKPIIAIKLRVTDYSGLTELGNRIIANMTGNANFATPMPALAVLQTAVTDVENGIAKWGPQGNRGSHADVVDLRQKAITLAQTLKSLSQYVQNVAQTAAGSDYPTMATIITGSGFALANARTPQGVLQAVQNFHAAVSPRYNQNQVKLMWRKPLNVTVRSNVKDYRILRGTSPVFSAAVQIASSTRTSFVDTNTTGVTQTWYYWVVPVNSAGDGHISEAVIVGLFSI